MNPELQRNLWLELTTRRATMMFAVPSLIFLAAASVAGTEGVARAAEYLFYGLVIIWGSRESAQSIVGEIRDRTWDSQRLSALTPFTMTCGKLLGATAYTWVGGLYCLVILLLLTGASRGAGAALFDLGYFVSLGLMAQTTALFTSLLAVRRRQAHSRFEIFLYQMAGIIAAWIAWWVWQRILRDDAVLGHQQTILWWNTAIDGRSFFLVSLQLFLIWAFVGCYRLMRIELQARNTPLVWAGFLAFLTVYLAGFQDLGTFDGQSIGITGQRFLVAACVLACLTYGAVLFEPKDRVLYRWLLEAWSKRRFKDALTRAQGWMIAYAACFVVTFAAAIDLRNTLSLTLLSGLGFVTRDIAIFLFFPLLPGQRRGDLAAVVTLMVLYVVLPQLLGGSGLGILSELLIPFSPVPSVFGPVFAWAEAAGAWMLVFSVNRSQRISPAVGNTASS